MIDFHSHILPGIDDGADNLSTSLMMLKESREQGVDVVFLTPHFYADERYPEHFLKSRDRLFEVVKQAVSMNPSMFPQMYIGAEVLYYPGMSGSEELASMVMEATPFLLVEPPMIPWSDSMLDEIEDTGRYLGLLPVVAHVDRYMRVLQDYTLLERVNERKLLSQVNASFFIHRDTRDLALNALSEKRFHFVGSDCHNLTDRAQNMGRAADIIYSSGLSEEFSTLNNRIYSLLRKA